jgi:alginate O-acetyltransferase complex protein AlgI
MLFSDVVLYLYLSCIAILYYVLPKRYQNASLALSGMAFYAFYTSPRILLFFFVESLVVFKLAEYSVQAKGRKFLTLGIIVSSGLLCFFKYRYFIGSIFFINQKRDDFITPLAISFFTFEFIHYSIERWRGGIPKRPSWTDYFTFIFFFPTMIAGPIKRFPQFFSCIYQPRFFLWSDLAEGLTRISFGLFKKRLLADNLTDLISNQPNSLSELGMSVLAYGFRIYFDFSGYSDLAIGCARIFGIRVPENFDFPYLRINIAEFWKHWHISLYRWIVDYIFIPLGGSRGTLPRICFNVILAMFISGLWHGAGLNFILWGLCHGFFLVMHRLWVKFITPYFRTGVTQSMLYRGFSWGLTMICVWSCWLIFMYPMTELQKIAQLFHAKFF